ncbi:Hypothetical predicted protein [Pelobates cultripes]|uniref:Uncharacterized protein n=1 Tax=Pelobates cultripes TaxID=61616 RepID=A0AAD1WVT2_PELCU|nr:Hypothetical predicted protein [Pelobates cultripes]
MHDIDARMGALEELTDELCLANSEVVDKIYKMEAYHKCLVEKLSDLEYRSRRNNIWIR